MKALNRSDDVKVLVESLNFKEKVERSKSLIREACANELQGFTLPGEAAWGTDLPARVGESHLIDPLSSQRRTRENEATPNRNRRLPRLVRLLPGRPG